MSSDNAAEQEAAPQAMPQPVRCYKCGLPLVRHGRLDYRCPEHGDMTFYWFLVREIEMEEEATYAPVSG